MLDAEIPSVIHKLITITGAAHQTGRAVNVFEAYSVESVTKLSASLTTISDACPTIYAPTYSNLTPFWPRLIISFRANLSNETVYV